MIKRSKRKKKKLKKERPIAGDHDAELHVSLFAVVSCFILFYSDSFVFTTTFTDFKGGDVDTWKKTFKMYKKVKLLVFNAPLGQNKHYDMPTQLTVIL